MIGGKYYLNLQDIKEAMNCKHSIYYLDYDMSLFILKTLSDSETAIPRGSRASALKSFAKNWLPCQVFCFKFCEISQNIIFTEHIQLTAFAALQESNVSAV